MRTVRKNRSCILQKRLSMTLKAAPFIAWNLNLNLKIELNLKLNLNLISIQNLNS